MLGPADPLAKTWGWSTRVYCNEQIQVERLYVRPGGYSSIHLHRHKANQFCVLNGDMAVNLFDDENRLMHCESLPIGRPYVVMPPERHQFVARSIVEGYEMYWTVDDTLIDPADIERFSTNGMDEQWITRVINAEYVCCCRCNRQFYLHDLTTVCVENALRDMCRDCLNQTSTQPFNMGGE